MDSGSSRNEQLVRRIDHIGIVVRSIDEALGYYVATLGMTVLEDGPRPDATVRLAYLAAGDTILQLVEPLSDGPAARFLAAQGEGLHHICFDVANLPAALASISEARDVVVESGGRGCQVAFLGDRPNNVLIELSQAPG